MDSRKSGVHKRVEAIQASVSSSSPLRRKSILQDPSISNVSENDDEAERIARRREKLSSLSPNSNRRHSLGLGFLSNIPLPQMTESINQCIKLSTENKINIKNAFSLEMIDLMTYMVKKQDVNMTNLQVASTSLDVSTKIYAYRVDNLYMEILKISGGLATNDINEDEDRQDKTMEKNEEADAELPKKKKKKIKEKFLCTMEALNGNIEISKPMLAMIGEEDLQTTDMLLQGTLPNHANTGFWHHPYHDVLVDVEEDTFKSLNNLNDKYTVSVEDFSNSEICSTFSNFEYLNWSPDDEPELEPELNDDNDRFRFDLDASVEQDNPAPECENDFYMEHDYENNQVNNENNVQGCYQQKTINCSNRIPLNVLNSQPPSEYSYIGNNSSLHWAGLSHWKFSFPKVAAAKANIKVAYMQAKSQKKNNFELTYNEESLHNLPEKYKLSHSIKLQAKTVKMEWNSENLILPEDMHYDITQLSKLYWHRNIKVKSMNNEDENENMHSSDLFGDQRYDYNNVNDTLEYCPNVEHDDDYDDDENRDGDDVCNPQNQEEKEEDCNYIDNNIVLNSQGLTGDNLVAAPMLVKKVHLTYPLKAKRIDMKQLKNSMWNCLTSTNDGAANTENVKNITEDKKFSDVYKYLPKVLSKSNAEALSVPISFMSMLHLANEKGLELFSTPDMSDIIIKAGNSTDL